MTELNPALLKRAKHRCELCEGTSSLSPYTVPSVTPRDAASVLVCETCLAQLSPDVTLDPNLWYGLQGAIWSEHPATQVLSWRLLQRLSGEAWARDTLEQLYLDADLLAWAREGADRTTEAETRAPCLDNFGNTLNDGDAVTLVKDLDVKGTSFVAKRGTVVKKIRLTDNPRHVEGRVNGVEIILKTEFLKRA